MWIFQLLGSVNLYATGEMMAATLKGLYRLGDSLGVSVIGNLRFVASRRTWSLTLYGLNRGVFLIQVFCVLLMAS